jgi:hypothetical protein
MSATNSAGSGLHGSPFGAVRVAIDRRLKIIRTGHGPHERSQPVRLHPAEPKLVPCHGHPIETGQRPPSLAISPEGPEVDPEQDVISSGRLDQVSKMLL